jgi:hypothetical protein
VILGDGVRFADWGLRSIAVYLYMCAVAGYKGWTEVSKGEALPPYFGDIPGAADPYNTGTPATYSLSIMSRRGRQSAPAQHRPVITHARPFSIFKCFPMMTGLVGLPMV